MPCARVQRTVTLRKLCLSSWAEQSLQQLIVYSALSKLGRHFSPLRTTTTLNSDLNKSAPAWIQLHVFSALSFFKPQAHMHPRHITEIETSDSTTFVCSLEPAQGSGVHV